MLIVIDLDAGQVSLRDPADFSRFSVSVEGEAHGDLAGVVRRSGLGRLRDDGEHVVVDPGALRVLAGPAADAAWDEGFSGMCAYAAEKGWTEEGGVVAHIERDHQPG